MAKLFLVVVFFSLAFGWAFSIQRESLVQLSNIQGANEDKNLYRAVEPAERDTILRIDFESEAGRSAWSMISSARWIKEGPSICLFIDVPPDRKMKDNMVRYKFDLSPYRGMMICFRAIAKADNVTKPPQPYLGIKYMLHYKSKDGEFWKNQDNVYGTFDWRELSFIAPISDDAADAEISLGLQNSSGKVWFDNLTVSIVKKADPRLSISKAGDPIFKGHDLPRLRGVMSPEKFREDDFRTLGSEWNANLIRWQIKKTWGDSTTEKDIDKYQSWIDSKCADLDKALDACLRYGLKLVIDLHSPPGGRDADGNMLMLYEKKYNECFIAVWEKIARRYKGSPAVWGYDLINEPAQNKPSPDNMDFSETQTRAAKAIRNIDSSVAIIIEAEDYDNPASFKYLKPVGVPNVLYEVHVYQPIQFTHQGLYDSKTAILYPGMIAGKMYNKGALKDVLKPVRDFQLVYNVHIYVGEFSAIRWAVGAAQYLSDCIDIFEEYGWDWSYHAFREWPGWSVEHENQPVDRNRHTLSRTNTDRKNLLLHWFAQNKKPVYSKNKVNNKIIK